MKQCRDITRLVSESLDRKLSWLERLQVRVHLSFCVGCTRFATQLHFLRRAFRSRFHDRD